MKAIVKYLGVLLIIIGVVIFAIDYFFKINSNAFLIVGLASVLVGVIGQIWTMKREGEVSR